MFAFKHSPRCATQCSANISRNQNLELFSGIFTCFSTFNVWNKREKNWISTITNHGFVVFAFWFPFIFSPSFPRKSKQFWRRENTYVCEKWMHAWNERREKSFRLVKQQLVLETCTLNANTPTHTRNLMLLEAHEVGKVLFYSSNSIR